MSEREPITAELRRVMNHTTMAGIPLVEIGEYEFGHRCDAIDAVHAGLERENESLKVELDRVLGEQEPHHIGEATVTITPTLDWTGVARELRAIAATLGSCNCSNSERTRTCLPHFWTHDGTLHVELPKLPGSISVRLPDQRDREVRSARTWQYTRDSGTCHITDNGPWGYPYVCSACGASFDPDVNGGELNYCPNCGRRIEVDDG